MSATRMPCPWPAAVRRRHRPGTWLRVLAPALLAWQGAASADVSLRWQQDRAPSTPLLAEYLIDSDVISDFIELVAANFAFPEPFVVAVGTAGGPDYDPATNTVRLPYAYVERAVRTQSELLDGGPAGDGEEALAVRRALDVVEYTLYHLLGHALAGSDGIEVDELAEGYSTWAMLGHWPGGAAQWQAATRAFAQASQRLDGPLSDYWHAHGLYVARERLVECWIVGREPALARNASRPLSEAEIGACAERWTTLEVHSRAALDALLLEDAPLRGGFRATVPAGDGAGVAADGASDGERP